MPQRKTHTHFLMMIPKSSKPTTNRQMFSVVKNLLKLSDKIISVNKIFI